MAQSDPISDLPGLGDVIADDGVIDAIVRAIDPRPGEALVEIGQKELKRNEVFVLPGFAKFVVAKKAGRPAGMYKNPFTKQEEHREAKPPSKTVRARPIKALKDAVS